MSGIIRVFARGSLFKFGAVEKILQEAIKFVNMIADNISIILYYYLTAGCIVETSPWLFRGHTHRTILQETFYLILIDLTVLVYPKV